MPAVCVVPKTVKLTVASNVSANDFSNTTIHLFTNNIAVNAATLTEDGTVFEEATFGGYAEVTAVDFQEPFYQADGTVALQADDVDIRHDGTGAEETVYGFWVEDGSSANRCIAAVKFDEPVPMEQLGHACIFQPRIILDMPA